MRISARNSLKGRIVSIEKGATTAHDRIDVGGAIVTSRSPTRRSRNSGSRRAGGLRRREGVGRHYRRRLTNAKGAPRGAPLFSGSVSRFGVRRRQRRGVPSSSASCRAPAACRTAARRRSRRSVAISMPPMNAGADRVAAGRARAGRDRQRTTPRMNASDVITIGRSEAWRLPGGVERRQPFLAFQDREFHDQDRVFRGHSHKCDEADLEVGVRSPARAARSPAARRTWQRAPRE